MEDIKKQFSELLNAAYEMLHDEGFVQFDNHLRKKNISIYVNGEINSITGRPGFSYEINNDSPYGRSLHVGVYATNLPDKLRAAITLVSD